MRYYQKKFEIESPFLFGCNFGAAGIEVLDLLDWMDENRLIFEYMDTLDTMYSKDGKFYIARFEGLSPRQGADIGQMLNKGSSAKLTTDGSPCLKKLIMVVLLWKNRRFH